ncbi:hypothetical protein QTJ16_002510 [Diplocarpon rosae]|uniref:Uncharacterized protein n=1 Tax=Diplocarpon rosae TaxID=946125 RepID=A0AAD9T3G5_9HELO|nr:hypothetical protein QTJ16_002510 [Diplocarpon rosae]
MIPLPIVLLCVTFLLGSGGQAKPTVQARVPLPFNTTVDPMGTDVHMYTQPPILPGSRTSIWASATTPIRGVLLTNITVTNDTFDPGNDQSSDESSECITPLPGEAVTVFSIVPNTTTVTVTRYGNESMTLPIPYPEFTPPIYCSALPSPLPLLGAIQGQLDTPAPNLPPVTVITTRKNAATVTTDARIPKFPGAGGQIPKQTVDPKRITTSYIRPTPHAMSFPPIPKILNGDGKATARITQVVDGKTIVVSPHQAFIGGQIVEIKEPPKTITEGGDVFTVSPGQVQGPGFAIIVPTYTPGAVFQDIPAPSTPITIQGVPVQVGPTNVVLGSSTIPIPPGATPTKFVVGIQTISVGPDGVAFAPQDGFPGTIITPPPSIPTNVVVVGGKVFSVIRNSIAVIGDRELTYGPGIPAQAVVFNGEVITVGPEGVVFDGKTIGGPSQAGRVQYGVAGGVSIYEVGSALAIINGVRFAVGPGSSPVTTEIAGQKIIAGPGGINAGGNVLAYPFNLEPKPVTAGGITFSQIGNSVVIIGEKTYRYGPGAAQVTATIDGQVVRIGPDGIGFASTTFTGSTSVSPSTPSHEADSSGKSENGAGRGMPGFGFGLWTTCLILCIWIG